MSYTDTDELTRGASTFMKSLRTIGMDPMVLVMVPGEDWDNLSRIVGHHGVAPAITYNGITFMKGTR